MAVMWTRTALAVITRVLDGMTADLVAVGRDLLDLGQRLVARLADPPRHRVERAVQAQRLHLLLGRHLIGVGVAALAFGPAINPTTSRIAAITAAISHSPFLRRPQAGVSAAFPCIGLHPTPKH